MASNPHATPQDTLAALRTRYTGELADLAVELAHGRIPRWLSDGFERDARLKLAQLERLERRVLSEDELQGICLPDDEADLHRHEDALSLLRLLAESAGEAVAW